MAPKKSTIISSSALQFLHQYINAPSPTGFECRLPHKEKTGQQFWVEYMKPFVDDHYIDTYGTAVGIINPKADYKIVIEAHADEISWYVHYITKDGFIYLRRNGGSDHQIAPSKRVNIHTE